MRVHDEFILQCQLTPYGKYVLSILGTYPFVVSKINTRPEGRIWYWGYEFELNVPIPDTFENFMVCLHEFGHGINNYQSRIWGKVNAELWTERWTMKKAKELGFGRHPDMEYYVTKRVAGNLLECLALENEMYFLPKLNNDVLTLIKPLIKYRKIVFNYYDDRELRIYRKGDVLTLIRKNW